ncbi:MAG: L-threonine 3-dehydrogenase [Deltaproteobacteria bacterium]|nr:L-threonine 3-dehydrogenase [Deltaproteobacteria bacterium]
MKTLMKLKPEEGLWMTEAPEPEPGPNDIKIKIRKTAICGTDAHIYNWDEWSRKTVKTPLIIGHEYSGEIVALGREVRGYSIGDRVSGEGHLTCGYCRNCRAGRTHLCPNTAGVGVDRPGAFAEFLVIPAFNAFKLPEAISDEVGALLDPLGNAVHTALSFDLAGEDVLIAGAGPIGIMAAAVCRHVGARHVVISDINEYRLNLARKIGVTLAINAAEKAPRDVMDELGMLEGFDVGLEMSGAPAAFQNLLSAMINGGKVALLGFLSPDTRIDWNEIILKGLLIKGIYGREMFETWYKMAVLIQGGLDIAPVITHRLHVSEFLEGFEAMRSGKSGKVILDWS